MEPRTIWFLLGVWCLALPIIFIIATINPLDIYITIFGAGLFAVPSGLCFSLSWLNAI